MAIRAPDGAKNVFLAKKRVAYSFILFKRIFGKEFCYRKKYYYDNDGLGRLLEGYRADFFILIVTTKQLWAVF